MAYHRDNYRKEVSTIVSMINCELDVHGIERPKELDEFVVGSSKLSNIKYSLKFLSDKQRMVADGVIIHILSFFEGGSLLGEDSSDCCDCQLCNKLKLANYDRIVRASIDIIDGIIEGDASSSYGDEPYIWGAVLGARKMDVESNDSSFYVSFRNSYYSVVLRECSLIRTTVKSISESFHPSAIQELVSASKKLWGDSEKLIESIESLAIKRMAELI